MNAQSPADAGSLEFTGERFVPGVPGEIWYEHWHRYHFALPLAAGRDVLDIACGEGYGSALLARAARRVTGADLSFAAIAHARARYSAISNLEFREADCASLPFADASFDLVVSFETVEHIEAQEAFLDEVRRVLRRDGLFVFSCPNKVEYTDKRGVANPFHVRELYRDEIGALVAPRFAHLSWYGQRPGFFSVVWPESGPVSGEIFEVSEPAAAESSPGHTRPTYFIVVASGSDEALSAVAPRLSVLSDRDEWIYRDYERVTRDLSTMHRQAQELGAMLAAERALAKGPQTPARTTAFADAGERDRLLAEIAERELEIARRSGWRWWIAWPLTRIRAALTDRAASG